MFLIVILAVASGHCPLGFIIPPPGGGLSHLRHGGGGGGNDLPSTRILGKLEGRAIRQSTALSEPVRSHCGHFFCSGKY